MLRATQFEDLESPDGTASCKADILESTSGALCKIQKKN
jgi:hypothetical protein